MCARYAWALQKLPGDCDTVLLGTQLQNHWETSNWRDGERQPVQEDCTDESVERQKQPSFPGSGSLGHGEGGEQKNEQV